MTTREAIPAEAYRLAVEVGGVGVWSWDPAADRASWSATWPSLLGSPVEELPGDLSGSLDLVHPDDRAGIEAALDDLLTGADERHVDYRLRHRDGSTRRVRGSARPVPASSGRSSIVLAVIDVTDQHLASTLAEQQLELDALFRSSIGRLVRAEPVEIDDAIDRTLADIGAFLGADQAIVAVPAGDGGGLEVSRRWEADDARGRLSLPPLGSLRWLERSLSAGTTVRIGHPDDLPTAAGNERAFLAAAGLAAIHTVPVTPEGHLTAVLWFASRRPNDWPSWASPVLHALAHACCQAIGRARLAQELQDTLDDLQHLVDAGPVLIWRGPGEGYELDWVSNNTPRLLGYDADFVAAHWADLLHPDDAAAAVETIERARATGEGHFVGRYRHADGTWRTWHVQMRVEHDDGRPVATNGYSIDITERHAAEERLRHAQRLEALGQLAGSVAHDFNNLLTVIYGYVDLAARRTDLEELREALRAAEHARKVVEQLLTFSRHGLTPATAVDLNGTVASMCSLLRPLLGSAIEVETELAPELPPVLSDRTQLEQVVANIVVNARDAMPEGGTLRVVTDRVDGGDLADPPGEPRIQLTVVDTGVGMSEEVAARAFDPFFTTRADAGGTGFGLATVYGAVTSVGGSVRIDSAPGVGTEVHVLLPVADAPETAPVPRASASEPEPKDTVILVVEDEPRILGLLEQALTNAGHTVVTAPDADAATEVAALRRIDLVLTDVSLPGRKGPELVAALREDRPDLRAVYMSGYSDVALALDERTNFLQKPFSIPQLTALVDEVLRVGR